MDGFLPLEFMGKTRGNGSGYTVDESTRGRICTTTATAAGLELSRKNSAVTTIPLSFNCVSVLIAVSRILARIFCFSFVFFIQHVWRQSRLDLTDSRF